MITPAEDIDGGRRQDRAARTRRRVFNAVVAACRISAAGATAPGVALAITASTGTAHRYLGELVGDGRLARSWDAELNGWRYQLAERRGGDV